MTLRAYLVCVIVAASGGGMAGWSLCEAHQRDRARNAAEKTPVEACVRACVGVP